MRYLLICILFITAAFERAQAFPEGAEGVGRPRMENGAEGVGKP